MTAVSPVGEVLRIADGVALPTDYVTMTAAILAQRRKGKRLALDTPVPTVDGWTTMGDVQVGDRLFDERGELCNVTYVSEVAHGDSYRVCFSDGSEIVADAEHLWLTESRAARRRESAIKAGVLAGTGRPGRPQSQQLKATKVAVRTTAEIAATLRSGRDTNHAVPVAGPLRLPAADLPIDPYVLGLWLGDGTRGVGAVTVHDDDLASLAQAQRVGYDVREQPSQRDGDTSQYTLRGLRPQLRSLGVLTEKHIPTAYLRASFEQRLALLQGLADADGTCSAQGQIELSVSDPRLADAAYELVVSLGIKATARWRATTRKPSCRIRFTSALPIFRLARKAARQRAASSALGRRFIVAVESTASVPMRCIAVDSPSRLYLAGESMIPTHNTYTAAVIAEELCDAGIPWVALDPTGAWWGLLSSADGESGGYPVVVIGGQHGALPLERGAGRVIADLVVDHPGWYVLDLSLLESRAAEREFATAFGERLHRRKMQPGMDFPLHLFIDEADLFVPQEREMKDDTRVLGAFQAIVRRGGLHGLGTTLISQRPALVNKSVLTQLDILILLRLVAGQDQDAVHKAFISRSSTKEQAAELMGSLASLRLGEAWLFEPGAEPPLLERVQIRERRTFNSSATPKPGELRIAPQVLAEVALDELRERLADAVERAKEDDPAELRRALRAERDRAAGLEQQIEEWKSQPQARPVGDPADLPAWETYFREDGWLNPDDPDFAELAARHLPEPEPGYTIGDLDEVWKIVQEARTVADGLLEAIDRMVSPLAAAILRAAEAAERKNAAPPAGREEATTTRRVMEARPSGASSGDSTAAVAAPTPAPDPPARPADGDASVPAPQQKILDGLAWWRTVGVNAPTRGQLAFVVGYGNPKSRGFIDPLYGLRSAELVEYGQAGTVTLTPGGEALARPPAAAPTEAEYRERIFDLVGAARAKILREVLARGEATRDELAEAVGYTNPKSRGFIDPLYRLRSLGLVEYPSPGTVRPSDLCYLR